MTAPLPRGVSALAVGVLLLATAPAQADTSYRSALHAWASAGAHDLPAIARSQQASHQPNVSRRATREFGDSGLSADQSALMHMLGCLGALNAGQFVQALAYCNYAITLQPKNGSAYKLRGEVYYSLARYREALADFERSIALDPSDPEAYVGRAEVHRLRHKYAAALADFDKAIALSPRDPRFLNARCWTRGEWNRQLAQALADCDAAIRLAPRFAPAHDSRGLIDLRLGRYRSAIRDYDRAIAIRPIYATAHFGRGIAKLHLGMRASGQADIRKARSIDPAIDEFFAAMGITGRGLHLPAASTRTSRCMAPGCRPARSAGGRKGAVARR